MNHEESRKQQVGASVKQVARGKQKVVSSKQVSSKEKDASNKQQAASRIKRVATCFVIQLIQLVLIKLYSFQFSYVESPHYYSGWVVGGLTVGGCWILQD